VGVLRDRLGREVAAAEIALARIEEELAALRRLTETGGVTEAVPSGLGEGI
jgi:hypothetical protein